MRRIHCPPPLESGASIALSAAAARHVQVLRLQPGDAVTLFDGSGGEHDATITRMGRSSVDVQVGAHHAIEREAALRVHLALGIPANERMDWLIEKATELGVASITPLMTERSVLRVSGERSDKKRAHWQAVATAACEQCGRNRVPEVTPPQAFEAWLRAATPPAPWVAAPLDRPSDAQVEAPADAAVEAPSLRCVLSLGHDAQPLHDLLATRRTASAAARAGEAIHLLSGPEGGLSPAEERAARAAGWLPLTLGARTLRAETAPLATLAALVLGAY